MPRLTRVSPPNVAGETRTAPGGASGQYPSGVGRQAGLARAGNDEGEFAIRRERSAAALYPMGLPVQPNHDAATRVGADAPDSEVILYRDSGSHQGHGISPPRISSAGRGRAGAPETVSDCYAPAR
jgi:hypothetical protein